MSNPVTNMQQLVSHWTTLMPLSRKSKKRGRDTTTDLRQLTKLKTQDVLHAVSASGPPHGIPTNNATFSNSMTEK